MRLAPQPGERIDRTAPVRFSFDGRSIPAYRGDTVASALAANDVRVLSRSFKYHRPRGELCFAGRCGHSMMEIDGWPGARACSELVRDGLQVTHINAWPSLRFDVMRAGDIVGGPVMPPGFYYKTFKWPRRMWPFYEKVLRNAAGLGKLRAEQNEREWRTDYRRRHCDVLVIGGGVAGLEAALAAALSGCDVVLADEDTEPGGRMLAEGAHEEARDLARRVRDAGVEVLSGAVALGFYDGLVPVWQGSRLHQVRAQRHIAATGTVQQSLVFPDNDLPGVMLSGGARRAASLYGVAPGSAVLVAATSDGELADALGLHEAGVRVVAVADLRETPGSPVLADALAAARIELLHGTTVVRAAGRGGVAEAVTARIDDRGRARTGTIRRHQCDVIAVGGGEVPASSLLLQAGARAKLDPRAGRFVADELPPGVHAAGSVAGAEDAATAAASGRVAGYEAALALGRGGTDAERELAAAREQVAAAAPPSVAIPPALATDGGRRGKAFVDLDEDVTAKDITYAAAEGFDSIQLAKRYTTATMGPSQGRFSQLPMARLLAEANREPLAEIGVTTARPPWTTVPLGVLAGRPIEPAKRSSIHNRHRELGATIRWAGDWRRAYDYGDPQGEALAVQDSAGLIDVSTLGKMIVAGPDAGRFLDRLYPNRLSNLAPGRIRYGVLTSEAGRITDDGTICRLDEDTFLVTTTSSGAGAVEQWFSWWLATWDDMDVRLTDVTQGLAAINLAGPKAREILGGLTDIDCSADGFPYLHARQGMIAGVPCLAMRIGFVGEVGYELHFPAAYGQDLWDAIMAAGQQHGIRPFGLEPQRILRLQKLHIIVGQDTDSESMPAAAAMSWIVKLDKEDDFIGRWALELAADRVPETKLVGFTCDGTRVPTEGAVILRGGVAAGQVTSSRYSPKLRRVIGMAWVPSDLAEEGAQVLISDAGVTLGARVATRPFYDPDGEVLRS